VAEAVVRSHVKKGIDKRRLITDKNYFKSVLDFVDAIAVTQGPGLAIALEVGVSKAKELALLLDVPLIAVDHMEGHLLSSLANRKGSIDKLFPALGILVSGGHTELIKVNGVGKYEKIGETLDDAIGEAFDKVARILDLGYPGGPIISELAKKGDPDKYPLPVAMKGSGDLNVSYSGLKTAVLYLVRDLKGQSRVQEKEKRVSYDEQKQKTGNFSEANEQVLSKEQICDVCASFQKAAVETIVHKVRKALQKYEFKTVLLGGGATNNIELRKALRKVVRRQNIAGGKSINFIFPYSKKLFQDNAAMIGVAAYLGGRENMLQGLEGIESLDREPGLVLGNH